ncbi:barrier-to-autointegration factor-like [Rhinatrema bivittatum]|uniref:barrier-to-autointegration factor-like n=1 Tax=Rhinatrema bivittatum TaxID=194408 RepID=UPI001125F4B2|nr:barrier-to-autointegration factor-like [Rhinatrema bivittatum]
MTGISQKHQRFLRDRIENNSVTSVPGIGIILGHRLIIKDCKTTADLLNVYKKDTAGFDAWLKKTCRANKRQRASCSRALAEWMSCTCQEMLCPGSPSRNSVPKRDEIASQTEHREAVCY